MSSRHDEASDVFTGPLHGPRIIKKRMALPLKKILIIDSSSTDSMDVSDYESLIRLVRRHCYSLSSVGWTVAVP